MKDINKIMEQLLVESDSTIIITNPGTLKDLQKDGLKLDQVTPTTPEEFIDKIFETKRKIAVESLKDVPDIPEVAIPTVNLLYKEIVECTIFGLDGAAISLSAILVEFALKRAIVQKKNGDNYDPKEWDRIEKIEFGSAILEAKQLGILDDATEKKFKDFKDQIRNPYLHYNIKKLTKGVVADKVKKLNVKTQEVDEVQLTSDNHPIIWPQAKKLVDKNNLKAVLSFTSTAIDLLLNNKKAK